MLSLRTDPAAQDVDLIHRFLSEESPWAKGIPKLLVRESIQNSLNFGLFESEAQIAYARVVTDYTTFAYLLDVFVLQEHRGKGHSRTLMEAILAHPRLQGLRRLLLVSSTARGLYAKYGFAPLEKPETFMEVTRAHPYASDSSGFHKRLDMEHSNVTAGAPHGPQVQPPMPATFGLGERVRKKSGAAWQGHIVGWYSTKLTPEGYAVESEAHPGSVQIYPVAALERVA